MDLFGPCALKLKLGPNVSESSSNPVTNDTQTSVQGSAGANSPTITAGDTVSYNDPALQLATVQALEQTIQAALTGAGGISSQAINVAQQAANAQSDSAAAQSADQSQILSEALAAQQALSSYQGTNGGLQQSTTTQYVIWGAIALGAIALLGFVFRRQ